MTKARTALARAAAVLRDICDTPRLDAELLMAYALGTSREALLLHCLDAPTPPEFAVLLARREAHEPIAYITGRRAFWTIELGVGPGVLVPRADSETLIEAAVDHFGAAGPATILDLGTGPGTLLLAALDQWPAARGLGVDCSPVALAMARRNATQNGSESRAHFVCGDWAGAVSARFDLVLSNPPYIGTNEALPPEVRNHEPALALFGGADGLAAYAKIIPDIQMLIAENGLAVLEVGATQAQAVSAMVAKYNGLGASIRVDLAGRERAVLVCHTG